MLAVYHVVCGQAPAGDLPGVPSLLDRAEVPTLPTGRVAVLDGNNLAPAQPRTADGLKLHTLWGELAYQLGGREGYHLVRASDKQGTSPGKDVLVQHFTAQYGTQVRIRVEIQAEEPSGFTDHLQRTVRVNCDVLGFTSAAFEQE